MKHLITSGLFKLFFTLIIGGISIQAFAQKTFEKKFEKSFSGVTIAKVANRQGPIEVLPSTDGKLSYSILLTFMAKEQEDANTLMKNFKVESQQLGSTVDIYSKMDIVQSVSKNGITKLKFKNGDRAKDLKDIKISMKLYIPNLEELELTNRYDKIIMEQAFSGNLKIDLYNGEVRALKATGNLEVDSKYSRLYFGDYKDADIDIYDAKMRIGNGNKMELETKYSEIEIGNLSTLEIESYDDEIEIGNITTELRLEDKYSEIMLSEVNSARMSLYDSELEIKKANNIQLKSKYSDFNFGKIGTLDFDLSYDDEVDIDELAILSIYETKYTNYDIRILKEKLDVNSYDDNIRIDQVSPTFKSLDFDGKYTDLDLTIDTKLVYQLDSETKSGNITFPEDRFKIDVYREISSETIIKGAIKNASTSSPLFKIDAYDCKIRLR